MAPKQLRGSQSHLSGWHDRQVRVQHCDATQTQRCYPAALRSLYDYIQASWEQPNDAQDKTWGLAHVRSVPLTSDLPHI